MSTTWADIQYTGQDNMGGLRSVRCTTLQQIVTLPGPNTLNVVELAATLTETGNWRILRHTDDTGAFREQQKLGPGSPEWTSTVRIFLAADDVYRHAQFEDMARYRWVVEAYDSEGNLRRMGDLRNPAKLTVDFTTDAQATGRRGYTLEWTWTNDRPAPYVVINTGLDGTYTLLPDPSISDG